MVSRGNQHFFLLQWSPLSYLLFGILNWKLKQYFQSWTSCLKHCKIKNGCSEFISSGCQVVKLFLQKYLGQYWFYHYSCFVTIWVLSQFKFCHNLCFGTIWVLSQINFITTWVLSQFGFCHNFNFATIFMFWHNFSYKVLSHLDFSSFVGIWVCKICHNFIVWVLSQDFLSFVKIWYF